MRKALVIAFVLAAVFSIQSPPAFVDVPAACAHLTPDDTFWWWFWNCGKDSSGGGGGGAGQP